MLTARISFSIIINDGWGLLSGSHTWGWAAQNSYMAGYAPFQVSGTVTQIRAVYFRQPGNSSEEIYFKILKLISGNPQSDTAVFELIWISDDLGSQVTKKAHNIITASALSVTINHTDDIYFGFYTDCIQGGADSKGSMVGYSTINNHSFSYTGNHLTIGQQVTYSGGTTTYHKQVSWDCKIITTSEYNEDSSPSVSGSTYIPAYDAPYYIILEKVVVPQGEDLTIVFQYEGMSNTFVSDRTIVIDCADAVPANHTITMGSDSKSLPSQAGDEIDIHILIDGADEEIDVIYCNFENGQGAIGNKDIRHISLTDRTPQSYTAGRIIRRVNITQSSGTGASISSLYTVYKPVILLSDSFSSQNDWATNNKTVLVGVGSLLAANNNTVCAFSTDKYVINAAINAGRVMVDSATSTALEKRWDGDDHDIIAYKHGIVVFVNGPSINDVINMTESSEDYFSGRLVGMLMHLAGDALANDNEVVMTQMIAFKPTDTSRTPVMVNSLARINELLMYYCGKNNIPFAKISDGYDTSWYNPGNTNVHSNIEGSFHIADKIVDAYEKNRIPNPLSRDYFVQFFSLWLTDNSEYDFNGDEIVNFIDYIALLKDCPAL